MKLIHKKDGTAEIIAGDADDYRCTDDNGVAVYLTKSQTEELKKMFCKNCPERIEYQSYCENKAEGGK